MQTTDTIRASADIPDLLAQMTEIDRAIRADGTKLGLDRLEELLNRYRSLQSELEAKREQQFTATARVIIRQATHDPEQVAVFLHDLALHWTEEALALTHSNATAIDVVDHMTNIVEED